MSNSFDVRALLEARGSEAFALHERYMNPQMPRILRTIGFDRNYVRADGAMLYDADGNEYLDFLAGFGVFALGRCNPKIEQALRDAIAASLPNLVQMECQPLSGLLAEALVQRMPTDDYRCFFTNSGAESVETVLKFARCATGRNRVVFADHAFHGLTTGALALNGGREFRERFGDLLPGVSSVPFGDLDALRKELEQGNVAAFVVEPIQGKGVYVAPQGYLGAAAELCHEFGALLAVDEVQTGLGRTGTFFAFEQWDVVPDIVSIAKALSGGYVPVGAVIA
ncbi:MAG TPA: aspartate aminotransferase family protein, partial [Acidimicrobiia bacterium]|nr:aspartate aminotransferase family protein [Acidimicrobiia bacterium]